MSVDRLRIAVQKSGRLSEISMELMAAAGLDVTRGKDGLFCRVENLPIDILLVRDDDIPGFVEDGVADLGVVGANVLEEHGARRPGATGPQIMRRLGAAKCRLSIAAPAELARGGPSDLDGLRIATSYPGLLARFCAEKGIACDIIEMKGSVEVAPRLGVADAICDLVSTGATLVANGLCEVETILESEAVLIGFGGGVPDEKAMTLDRLLMRLDGVLASAATKYVMLNAPAAAIDEIERLLPGAGGPTVLPIAHAPDQVAIHAVCREHVFWETMERLKQAGATAILVLPIEKMMA